MVRGSLINCTCEAATTSHKINVNWQGSNVNDSSNGSDAPQTISQFLNLFHVPESWITKCFLKFIFKRWVASRAWLVVRRRQHYLHRKTLNTIVWASSKFSKHRWASSKFSKCSQYRPAHKSAIRCIKEDQCLTKFNWLHNSVVTEHSVKLSSCWYLSTAAASAESITHTQSDVCDLVWFCNCNDFATAILKIFPETPCQKNYLQNKIQWPEYQPQFAHKKG